MVQILRKSTTFVVVHQKRHKGTLFCQKNLSCENL